MYNISSPFLGFENLKTLKIERVDEFFSTLLLDEEGKTKVHVVSIDYLNNLDLSYELDDIILEKFDIKSKDDIKVYFCVVIQEPIENSIVNLIAPIIVNEKEKKIGQYVTKDIIPQVFVTLKEASTL